MYANEETQCVDVDSLVGKCSVGTEAGAPGSSLSLTAEHSVRQIQMEYAGSDGWS